MRDNIRRIFEHNIDLIRLTELAVIYFREESYDKALGLTAQAIEQLREVSAAIFSDREYFQAVSDESVAEMLAGILETKKNKDYVLLADLFEMQLISFLCSVQELILKKEDYLEYNEVEYLVRKDALKKKLEESLAVCEADRDAAERCRVKQNALLDMALDPENLLSEGYRVEYTGCGRMTVGIRDNNGRNLYLHSNGRVSGEAFLLAKRWAAKKADTFIIYGLGMGYHIEELLYLSPDAKIEIYETDMNILKLSCAFSKIDTLLSDDELFLVYDPDGTKLLSRLQQKKRSECVCIHYPSLCNIRNAELKNRLAGYIPWAKLIERV